MLVQLADVMDPGKVRSISEAQRQQLLHAATAELVARLDALNVTPVPKARGRCRR